MVRFYLGSFRTIAQRHVELGHLLDEPMTDLLGDFVEKPDEALLATPIDSSLSFGFNVNDRILVSDFEEWIVGADNNFFQAFIEID